MPRHSVIAKNPWPAYSQHAGDNLKPAEKDRLRMAAIHQAFATSVTDSDDDRVKPAKWAKSAQTVKPAAVASEVCDTIHESTVHRSNIHQMAGHQGAFTAVDIDIKTAGPSTSSAINHTPPLSPTPSVASTSTGSSTPTVRTPTYNTNTYYHKTSGQATPRNTKTSDNYNRGQDSPYPSTPSTHHSRQNRSSRNSNMPNIPANHWRQGAGYIPPVDDYPPHPLAMGSGYMPNIPAGQGGYHPAGPTMPPYGLPHIGNANYPPVNAGFGFPAPVYGPPGPMYGPPGPVFGPPPVIVNGPMYGPPVGPVGPMGPFGMPFPPEGDHGHRVKGGLRSGVGLLFSGKTCQIHVIKGRNVEEIVHGVTFNFEVHKADATMKVRTLMEQLGAIGPGWAITQVFEMGEGEWQKGGTMQWEEEAKTAQSLEMLGWEGAGVERDLEPIWVVLHRVF
ncbi:hypothetical protein EJ06DRAFT_345359 [Trichodelitschia bisporula]|uniref:Uncharacterized protein n=1 Tax=Trichodelitschia bisporula TaxID=703511 RepID=A0A6G1I2R6_9PEZI|nr:hypothetical protein EJ06DRAFT_345359 [Trichodelitschia bisporula]